MTSKFETVSFLSDYGTQDEFVGVLKSVIRTIAPHVAVIDITHDIAAYDIRGGSLTLVRSAQYLCPGVVLGVVDPGVGTDRRCIAVEVGDGESVLVGPDNGLLAPVVAMVGGATRAVQLTNEKYQLVSPSATFAGRDVFAPAAAHLCNGVDISELGDSIDPAELQPAMIRFSTFENERLEANVIWIDRFGNAQLNVTPDQLDQLGDRALVQFEGGSFTVRRARSYGELGPGETGLIVDSAGLVSLAVREGSVAERFGLTIDTDVSIAAVNVSPG